MEKQCDVFVAELDVSEPFKLTKDFNENEKPVPYEAIGHDHKLRQDIVDEIKKRYDKDIIITDDCHILLESDILVDTVIDARTIKYKYYRMITRFEYYNVVKAEEQPNLLFIYSELDKRLTHVIETTPPRHSLHECLAFIEEEFLELREEIYRKESERSLEAIENELYDNLITNMRALLFIEELKSKKP